MYVFVRLCTFKMYVWCTFMTTFGAPTPEHVRMLRSRSIDFVKITGRPGYAVMRVLGVFQNFYAVIFIMRLCGYPHNFVSWFATFCKNSFNFTQFESLFTYNWIHFCNFFGDSKYKKHLRIIVYHPYHFFKDFTNQRTAILLYHLHIPIILR